MQTNKLWQTTHYYGDMLFIKSGNVSLNTVAAQRRSTRIKNNVQHWHRGVRGSLVYLLNTTVKEASTKTTTAFQAAGHRQLVAIMWQQSNNHWRRVSTVGKPRAFPQRVCSWARAVLYGPWTRIGARPRRRAVTRAALVIIAARPRLRYMAWK